MNKKTKNKILRYVMYLACMVLTVCLCLTFTVQTSAPVSAFSLRALKQKPIAVNAETSQNTYFAGGADIPENYRAQPNVLVTGFAEDFNDYCALEDYDNNKELVLINGRSWSHWETRPGDTIDRLWVRSAGAGACYLGFDFNGTSILKLPSQNGAGEILQTIILKRGFQFINTTSNQWEVDGVIYKDSPAVSNMVGTLEDNIILKVNDVGGFDVIVGGLESVEEQGETQYGVVTGSLVNVRRGPGTTNDICGQVARDTKLIYLGETSNGWRKVIFDEKTAWIQASYFTILGYETVVVQKPMRLEGYTIAVKREVFVTEETYIAKQPATVNDASTEAWCVAGAGCVYLYLKETSDGWYKVRCEDNVGWISNAYSTLTEQAEIIPLNADWQADGVYDEDSSSLEDLESDEASEDGGFTESDSSITEDSVTSSEEDNAMGESSSSEDESDKASVNESASNADILTNEDASLNTSVENSEQTQSEDVKTKGCSSKLAFETAFGLMVGFLFIAIFNSEKQKK